MTENEIKQIEEMAGLKQTVTNVAQDVSRLVNQMDMISSLQREIIEMRKDQENGKEAFNRAFTRIENLETSTGVIKESSNKWINRGVGAWAVGTILFAVIQALVIDRVKDYERTQTAQTEMMVTVDRRLSWIEFEQKRHVPTGAPK